MVAAGTHTAAATGPGRSRSGPRRCRPAASSPRCSAAGRPAAVRLRPERQLALGVHPRARRSPLISIAASWRAGPATPRRRRALAGLARPDHDRGRAVRAAVRDHPGPDQRVGQRARSSAASSSRRSSWRCSSPPSAARRAPLLRLDLFANRAFAVAAIVTVLGMFAILGTAYATSIRLSAIQGFTPLKTSIAFVLLNGMTLLQVPLTIRLLPSVNPRWTLGGRLRADRRGGPVDVARCPPRTCRSRRSIAPLALVGIGFAFRPLLDHRRRRQHGAEPAGGHGQRLDEPAARLRLHPRPRVVGAIALSRAAADITPRSPPARPCRRPGRLQCFPGARPGRRRSPRGGGGQRGQLWPARAKRRPGHDPLSGGKRCRSTRSTTIAFHALDHAYYIGYVVCGSAAAVSFVLAAVALGGRGELTSRSPSASSTATGSMKAPT